MSVLNKVNVVSSLGFDCKVCHKLNLRRQETTAGVFSTYAHSWITCGSDLFIVNNNDGVLQSYWTFGECVQDELEITCAVELPMEGCAIPLLILGIGSENTNLISFFNPNTRKILRTIDILYPIRTICVIEDGTHEVDPLNDALTNTEGLVAVGCAEGTILLVDLCRSILCKAINGDFQLYSTEENPSDAVYIEVGLISSIGFQQTITSCRKKQDSVAVILTDPSDEGITALLYSMESAILFVGTSSGSFHLWNMSSLSCLFKSPGIGRAIISMSLLEPCDDPRHFLYLWICFEEYPQVPMYCISFSSKFIVDGYGVYYQNFESAGLAYKLTLGMEVDMLAARPINSQAVAKLVPKSLVKCIGLTETEGTPLRLFVTAYEIVDKGQVSTRAVIFDLNQWYRDQMPVEAISSCLDSIDLDCKSLWHLQLDPRTLTLYQCVRQQEQHFHPTSFDFQVWCIEEEGVRCLEKLGVQTQWLRNMCRMGSKALLEPTRVFLGAIAAGLLPSFIDPPDPEANSQVEERSYVLTVCLENRAIAVIDDCAKEWNNGSHTVRGCTIQYLIDWLWGLHRMYKSNGNRICIPLFDQSGMKFDSSQKRSLQHCKFLLNTVQSIYTNITNRYRYILMSGVEEKLTAMSLVRLYFDCCLKLISVNLLPEPNELGRPVDSIMYIYNDIRNYVNNRRKECLFLGDSLIGKTGVESKWEEESEMGSYPPPSIQSVLRFCLHPSPSLAHKMSLLMYLFMDIINSYSSIRNQQVLEKIKNFQHLMRVSEVQFKIVAGCWYLDHSMFEEGVDLLLDPRVLSLDLTEDQHRDILRLLVLKGQEKLALQYLRLKSPSLHLAEDLRMELNLLLRNQLVNEAFLLQRKHPEMREILLEEFFRRCIERKQLGQVFGLNLDLKEECVLMKYLKSSGLRERGDLQVLLLLSKAKYTEAMYLNDRLNSTLNGPKSRIETDTRDMIVKGITGSLNSISCKMAHEMKIYRPPPTGTYPKPLSTLIKVLSGPDGPLCQTDSNALLCAVAKSTRHLSDFVNSFDYRHRRKRDEEEEIDVDLEEAPARKRLKLLESVSGVNRSITVDKQFSSPCKPTSQERDVMELVGTPLVKKRGTRFSPQSRPSSILKGKTPEKSMDPEEFGETPKKTLRFFLPENEVEVTPRKPLHENEDSSNNNPSLAVESSSVNILDKNTESDNLRKRVSGRKPIHEDHNTSCVNATPIVGREQPSIIDIMKGRLRSSAKKKMLEDGVNWSEVAEVSKPPVLFSQGVSWKKSRVKPLVGTPLTTPRSQVLLDITITSAEKNFLDSPSREFDTSPATEALFHTMTLPKELFTFNKKPKELEDNTVKEILTQEAVNTTPSSTPSVQVLFDTVTSAEKNYLYSPSIKFETSSTMEALGTTVIPKELFTIGKNENEAENSTIEKTSFHEDLLERYRRLRSKTDKTKIVENLATSERKLDLDLATYSKNESIKSQHLKSINIVNTGYHIEQQQFNKAHETLKKEQMIKLTSCKSPLYKSNIIDEDFLFDDGPKKIVSLISEDELKHSLSNEAQQLLKYQGNELKDKFSVDINYSLLQKSSHAKDDKDSFLCEDDLQKKQNQVVQLNTASYKKDILHDVSNCEIVIQGVVSLQNNEEILSKFVERGSSVICEENLSNCKITDNFDEQENIANESIIIPSDREEFDVKEEAIIQGENGNLVLQKCTSECLKEDASVPSMRDNFHESNSVSEIDIATDNEDEDNLYHDEDESDEVLEEQSADESDEEVECEVIDKEEFEEDGSGDASSIYSDLGEYKNSDAYNSDSESSLSLSGRIEDKTGLEMIRNDSNSVICLDDSDDDSVANEESSNNKDFTKELESNSRNSLQEGEDVSDSEVFGLQYDKKEIDERENSEDMWEGLHLEDVETKNLEDTNTVILSDTVEIFLKSESNSNYEKQEKKKMEKELLAEFSSSTNSSELKLKHSNNSAESEDVIVKHSMVEVKNVQENETSESGQSIERMIVTEIPNIEGYIADDDASVKLKRAVVKDTEIFMVAEECSRREDENFSFKLPVIEAVGSISVDEMFAAENEPDHSISLGDRVADLNKDQLVIEKSFTINFEMNSDLKEDLKSIEENCTPKIKSEVKIKQDNVVIDIIKPSSDAPSNVKITSYVGNDDVLESLSKKNKEKEFEKSEIGTNNIPYDMKERNNSAILSEESVKRIDILRAGGTEEPLFEKPVNIVQRTNVPEEVFPVSKIDNNENKKADISPSLSNLLSTIDNKNFSTSAMQELIETINKNELTKTENIQIGTLNQSSKESSFCLISGSQPVKDCTTAVVNEIIEEICDKSEEKLNETPQSIFEIPEEVVESSDTSYNLKEKIQMDVKATEISSSSFTIKNFMEAEKNMISVSEFEVDKPRKEIIFGKVLSLNINKPELTSQVISEKDTAQLVINPLKFDVANQKSEADEVVNSLSEKICQLSPTPQKSFIKSENKQYVTLEIVPESHVDNNDDDGKHSLDSGAGRMEDEEVLLTEKQNKLVTVKTVASESAVSGCETAEMAVITKNKTSKTIYKSFDAEKTSLDAVTEENDRHSIIENITTKAVLEIEELKQSSGEDLDKEFGKLIKCSPISKKIECKKQKCEVSFISKTLDRFAKPDNDDCQLPHKKVNSNAIIQVITKELEVSRTLQSAEEKSKTVESMTNKSNVNVETAAGKAFKNLPLKSCGDESEINILESLSSVKTAIEVRSEAEDFPESRTEEVEVINDLLCTNERKRVKKVSCNETCTSTAPEVIVSNKKTTECEIKVFSINNVPSVETSEPNVNNSTLENVPLEVFSEINQSVANDDVNVQIVLHNVEKSNSVNATTTVCDVAGLEEVRLEKNQTLPEVSCSKNDFSPLCNMSAVHSRTLSEELKEENSTCHDDKNACSDSEHIDSELNTAKMETSNNSFLKDITITAHHESNVVEEAESKSTECPKVAQNLCSEKSFFFGKEDIDTYIRATKATFQVGSRVSLPGEDDPIDPMEIAMIDNENNVLEFVEPHLDLSLRLSPDIIEKPMKVDRGMVTDNSYFQRRARRNKKSSEGNLDKEIKYMSDMQCISDSSQLTDVKSEFKCIYTQTSDIILDKISSSEEEEEEASDRKNKYSTRPLMNATEQKIKDRRKMRQSSEPPNTFTDDARAKGSMKRSSEIAFDLELKQDLIIERKRGSRKTLHEGDIKSILKNRGDRSESMKMNANNPNVANIKSQDSGVQTRNTVHPSLRRSRRLSEHLTERSAVKGDDNAKDLSSNPVEPTFQLGIRSEADSLKLQGKSRGYSEEPDMYRISSYKEKGKTSYQILEKANDLRGPLNEGVQKQRRQPRSNSEESYKFSEGQEIQGISKKNLLGLHPSEKSNEIKLGPESDLAKGKRRLRRHSEEPEMQSIVKKKSRVSRKTLHTSEKAVELNLNLKDDSPANSRKSRRHSEDFQGAIKKINNEDVKKSLLISEPGELKIHFKDDIPRESRQSIKHLENVEVQGILKKMSKDSRKSSRASEINELNLYKEDIPHENRILRRNSQEIEIQGTLKGRRTVGRRSSHTFEVGSELNIHQAEDLPETSKVSRKHTEEPKLQGILKKKFKLVNVSETVSDIKHFPEKDFVGKGRKSRRHSEDPQQLKNLHSRVSSTLRTAEDLRLQHEQDFSDEGRELSKHSIQEDSDIKGILKGSKSGKRSSYASEVATDLKLHLENDFPSKRDKPSNDNKIKVREIPNKGKKRRYSSDNIGSKSQTDEENIKSSMLSQDLDGKSFFRKSLIEKGGSGLIVAGNEDAPGTSQMAMTVSTGTKINSGIKHSRKSLQISKYKDDIGNRMKIESENTSNIKMISSTKEIENENTIVPEDESMEVISENVTKGLSKSQRITPEKKHTSPKINEGKKRKSEPENSIFVPKRLEYSDDDSPSKKKSRSLIDFPIKRNSRLPRPALEDIKEEEDEEPKKKKSMDDLHLEKMKKKSSSTKKSHLSKLVVEDSDAESDVSTPELWKKEFMKDTRVTRTQQKLFLMNQQLTSVSEVAAASPTSNVTYSPRRSIRKKDVIDSPSKTPSRSSLRLQKKPPSETD